MTHKIKYLVFETLVYCRQIRSVRLLLEFVLHISVHQVNQYLVYLRKQYVREAVIALNSENVPSILVQSV